MSMGTETAQTGAVVAPAVYGAHPAGETEGLGALAGFCAGLADDPPAGAEPCQGTGSWNPASRRGIRWK